MAAVFIANPAVGGGVNAASAADRYAGVNSVRSDGVNVLRWEAALKVAQYATDTPTYVVSFNVAAPAGMDVFEIAPSPIALGAAVVRLQRIVLVNPGSATAAAVVDLQLGYSGAFGSGGAAVIARSVDPVSVGARAAGVTGGPDSDIPAQNVRVGDTVLSTPFTALYNPLVSVSVPAAAAGFTPQVIYSAANALTKPLIVSGGGAAIVLRIPAVGAGATGFRGYFEFTHEPA